MKTYMRISQKHGKEEWICGLRLFVQRSISFLISTTSVIKRGGISMWSFVFGWVLKHTVSALYNLIYSLNH